MEFGLYSLRDMQMITESTYSIETTRKDLNSIVDYFRRQPWQEEIMTAVSENLRHLPREILDQSKCFFIPEVIEKRKPLPPTARRAGWTGCNILLKQIPDFAKIPIIKNGVSLDPKNVCREYNRVYSLQTNSIESRGWLFDVLNCVERLDTTFTLKQMYEFVNELKIKHPTNHNVEAKIRQQLQFLRDKGFVEFTSRGSYKKIGL